MTGYYMGILVQEVEEFTLNSEAQLRANGVKLNKVSIFENPKNGQKEIHFDYLPGEGYWGGYVKGFLYKDFKFYGWFHYVAEAKLPKIELIGTYKNTENGIELKGIEDDDGRTIGAFFIKLEQREAINKGILIENGEPQTNAWKKYQSIFTKELAEQLTVRANKQKSKAKRRFDHYQALLNMNLKPESPGHFVLAASAAYSWMPTMLELFPEDPGNLTAELKAVQELGSIKSLRDFEQKEEKIAEHLVRLTNTINHSVVGASKTLHLFYPDNVPILDSRVLKAWQKLFSKYYKKYPALKLTKAIPYYSNRQVPLYMNYWKLMLQWKENAGYKTVRGLEEALYWLGK